MNDARPAAIALRDVTKVYNRIDQYAEITGASILIVHHSSKGAQGIMSTP